MAPVAVELHHYYSNAPHATAPLTTPGLPPTVAVTLKAPRSPESPVAVSAMGSGGTAPTQQPLGKPPVSPPMARAAQPVAPLTTTTTLPPPGLARLPSLTERGLRPTPSQHQHPLQSQPPQQQPLPRRAPVAAVAPPPTSSMDEPTPRELAARLALLLHARECCTPFDQERLCGVRNCRVARGVLDHCQECFLPEGHCHRSCTEAKQLLRHFRICRAQEFTRRCTICDILRAEFSWAMEHARSLTPLFATHSVHGPDEAPSHGHGPNSYHPAHHQRYHHQMQPQHPAHRECPPLQSQAPIKQQHQDVSSLPPQTPGAFSAPPTTLRRAISEGPRPSLAMSPMHQGLSLPMAHKRSREQSSLPVVKTTRHSDKPTKRVRIVTPEEEERLNQRPRATSSQDARA